MKTTIDQIKEKYSEKIVEGLLKSTLDDIKFLESIYMTGGENSHFSDKFKNIAYSERQELCQISSACYSVLRNKFNVNC